jgi:hypothetical protein
LNAKTTQAIKRKSFVFIFIILIDLVKITIEALYHLLNYQSLPAAVLFCWIALIVAYTNWDHKYHQDYPAQFKSLQLQSCI